MVKEKTTKKAKTDAVPTPTPASTVSVEQDWNPGQPTDCYVVVRDGFRVSEKEYTTPGNIQAIDERDFWTRVAKDDGTKVYIVKYDKKKHRTW